MLSRIEREALKQLELQRIRREKKERRQEEYGWTVLTLGAVAAMAYFLFSY